MRRQAWMLERISADRDLGRHMEEAVRSLCMCLGAEAAIGSGRRVAL
jgi:hypothetical protein